MLLLLSNPAAGAGLGGMLIRCLSTSARVLQGAPTYTYTPPGSSIQDPSYHGTKHGSEAAGGDVAANSMPDSKVMRPSKKAQWLKVTTRKTAAPLEPQGSQPGAMLPPGCSMSDPHYSLKEPIYYVDDKN